MIYFLKIGIEINLKQKQKLLDSVISATKFMSLLLILILTYGAIIMNIFDLMIGDFTKK
jgi:hypothetical protein